MAKIISQNRKKVLTYKIRHDIISTVHETEFQEEHMYNTSKLKGRIIEKFGTQNAFAAATASSKTYVSLYMNGKVYLDQRTIEKWADALDISCNEIPVYFFAK